MYAGLPWRRAALSLVLALGAVNAACAGYRRIPVVGLEPPTGPVPVEGTPLLQIWKTHAGRGLARGMARSDTVLYLAGADRNVVALDLRSGAKRWTMRINGPVAEGLTVDDTRVYAVTDVPDGRTYALDAVRGIRAWVRTTGPSGAPPVLADGTLFVTTREGRLLALDPEDGSIRWKRTVGVSLSAPVATRPGTLMLATTDTLFRLESSSGRVLERRHTSGTVVSGWTRQGDLFLAGTSDSLVIAVPADTLSGGWHVRLDAPILATPVVSGDTIFAVSRIGTLYRIDPGGELAGPGVDPSGPARGGVAGGGRRLGGDRSGGGRVDRRDPGGNHRMADTTALTGGPHPAHLAGWAGGLWRTGGCREVEAMRSGQSGRSGRSGRRPALAVLVALAALTSSSLRAQAPAPTVKPIPALIKYGKWMTLAGSLAMNYLAARAHTRADDAFRVIEDACALNQDMCIVGPDGRYLNPSIESQYQRSVHYDRQARGWLIGGEAAFAGTAAMFIWELTRPKSLPGNIPFEPQVKQEGARTLMGLRLAF